MGYVISTKVFTILCRKEPTGGNSLYMLEYLVQSCQIWHENPSGNGKVLMGGRPRASPTLDHGV